MVTTGHVFNFKKNSVKRKINLEDIVAVTVSNASSEFVFHIPSEYDYRYASDSRRKDILL